MRVGSEEDRRSEDSLKRSNQATILGSTLLHPERVEHFRGAGEGDPARPLPVCQCSQKQWNQTILAPRKSVVRVAGDEKHESTIATFVDEGSSGRTLNRKAAKDKRPGGETDVLGCRTPAHPNTLDALNLAEPAPTEG